MIDSGWQYTNYALDMILLGATKETLIIQSHHGHVEKRVGSVPSKTLIIQSPCILKEDIETLSKFDHLD